MSSFVGTSVRSLAPLPVERGSRGASGRRLALSSRVYLPAFSIAAVAVVLVGIGFANRWGGSDFSGSMTDLRTVVAGPITLVIIGVFLVVERLRPAQRRPIFAPRLPSGPHLHGVERDARRSPRHCLNAVVR